MHSLNRNSSILNIALDFPQIYEKSAEKICSIFLNETFKEKSLQVDY